MRALFLGDERGTASAEHLIVIAGLVVLGVLCLYKAAVWADVLVDGVGSSSVEYAAYAPDVADVTEADFRGSASATARR